MASLQWLDRPILQDPVALIAFEGWGDAGESASQAATEFLTKLDAEINLDPLALAPYVDAKRVLMIITRTDAIIPFEAQQQLRVGMGSPETLYLVTGHRTSVVYFPKVRSAAFEFFERHFIEEQLALAVN